MRWWEVKNIDNFAGNGVLIPSVSLNPPNINFGSQVAGSTSAVQTSMVMNTGNGTLNLSNVSLTGPFSMTTTCGATLAANSSCNYNFKFAPSTTGPASGILTATTNAAGGLMAIGLNGTGVTGPVPVAQPASLTFGPQQVLTKSAAQPVTFSNAGDMAFTIAGVNASENFSATSNCPANLAPGASCTINVSFFPTTDTFTSTAYPYFPTQGNAYVTIGAPGSPFSIPLTGSATPSTGAATNLSIMSSLNPSTVGQSVTFATTVAPMSGNVTPTGTVTFFDSSTMLGTGTLSGGIATFMTSSLAQGTHTITAQYGGGSGYQQSLSPAVMQVVNAAGKAATGTVVVSSLNPSTVGQSVMFTATVTSQAAGTITGTVTFFDGTTQIGSPAIHSAGAALPFPRLPLRREHSPSPRSTAAIRTMRRALPPS